MLKTIAKWFQKGPSSAERRLLQRCAGDQAQMNRLIAGEMKRHPGLPRAGAADRALERWTRDR